MDESERKKLESRVKEEIAFLNQQMPTLEEEAKPVPPDNAVGRLSRMEAMNNKGVRDATLREAKERLRLLERRLERINEPDMDRCEGCRQPIVIARLLYIPETDRCVVCASR